MYAKEMKDWGKAGAAATVMLLLGLAAPLQAQEIATGTLNLSRAPLFLNQSVDPNVLVSFDDSGSMAFAYMPDAINTNCNWRHPRYYWHGYNRVYYNPAINYVPPLQPNGDPFPNASFTAAWNDGYEAATTIVAGAGGSSTINLETRYFPTRSANSRAGTNLGTRVGHDWRARNTVNCNNDNGADNNNAALPFAPSTTETGTGTDSAAFYYRFTGTDPTNAAQVANPANYVAVNVATAGAAQRQNFANWYAYYRTRGLFARTAASRAFAVLDQSIRVAWQNFNNDRLQATDEIRPLAGAWRTAFFNWLYRGRTSGGTPLRRSMIDAGAFFERGGLDFRNPYFEPATATAPAQELSCRQNFHITLTDGFWNEGNPTHVSSGSDTTAGPLPDGTEYNPSNAASLLFGNEPTNVPNAPTLADIAFHFWRNDLKPGLDDNVPPFFPDLRTGLTGAAQAPGFDPKTVPEVYFNPANNPATWQHMVNFIVGLGVAGGLNYPGDLDRLRTGDVSFPAPANNNFTGVDDTWHAALNSRGEYFSAGDPSELVTALTRLFSSVQARRASITPVSVSSPIQALGARAFRSGFDTSDWSGSVVALDFIPDDPSTPVDEETFTLRWQAEDLLDARDPNSRRILTSATPDGSSIVSFEWSSLSAAQQTALRRNPANGTLDPISVGQARLEYIRGTRSEEFANGGNFRNRSTVLGAVVNSGVAVVGVPASGYQDVPNGSPSASEDDFSFPIGSPERACNCYEDFQRNSTRDEVVYVGANDGMLHAFNSSTGEELWAFIPYAVYPNLSRLTSQLDLDFQSFVDATPDVRDMFVPGLGWRTILVGTLRLGGQGLFAIDVTDPYNPDVLWEYNDLSPGGEDLGFTYGSPFLTRLHDGNWVVLMPGGYNSEVNDGNSGNREAVLFIIEAFSGNVLRKFNLGAGTIGLGSVIGGDYRLLCPEPTAPHFCVYLNRNILDVTDQAFAGDLTGNLWRFDLTGSTPGSWSVERFFRAIGPTGRPQPITARPWLTITATRQAVVLVGTGKYIEPADRTRLIPVQTMYGVFDQGFAAASGDYPIIGRGRLLEQQLTNISADRRTLTSNLININTNRGWYFDFPDLGERAIVQTVVRASQGVGILPSLIPLSEDPCRPNAESFLLFYDVSNGGIPGSSRGAVDADGDGVPDFSVSFDTNGDGRINAADDAAQIGLRIDSFIAAVTPVTVPGGGEGRIILPGGDGTITSIDSLVVPELEWRRRSWRELFLD
jgi:type IV pilus assembly protein PilY1